MKRRLHLIIYMMLALLVPQTVQGQDNSTLREIYTQAENDYQLGRLEQALDSLQNNIWQSNFMNILDLQRKVLDSLDVTDFKNFQVIPKRIVYVIDGEKYEYGANAFSTLSPSDIKNITVLGEDSAEKLKYGENCTVILIETKRKNRK